MSLANSSRIRFAPLTRSILHLVNMVRLSVLALVSLGGVASAFAAPSYAKYPTLAEVKEKFYTEGVVPDVLPSFNPKSFLYLTYTGNLSDGTSSKIVLPGTSFARNGTSRFLLE
jgi:hypothetical protein